MANCFLAGGHEEVDTAILLEKAVQCNLGELDPSYANAVAFTDGKKVYINSDDRLAELLPAYDHKMLKWLLWHEEYHKQLVHHKRYFTYLKELRASEELDEFKVTQEEVNIIMDILVHDSLSKMFPELVETATNNLAQMRNRNSLGYTFKTNTLEDMLNEYKAHKRGEDSKDDDGKGTPKDSKDSEGVGDTKAKSKSKTKDSEGMNKDKRKRTDTDDGGDTTGEKGHKAGGSGESASGKDTTPPEVSDKETTPETTTPDEHDKTDWSKLDNFDSKEFIEEDEGEYIQRKVERLKRTKIKLARLTETLNGLATTTRVRTYAMPSYITAGKGIMLKGRKQGKTALYLVFDASGSMGGQLQLFKDIISKSIPHAMEVPCEWFAGYNPKMKPYKIDMGDGYYKGKFKDIMETYASSGYSNDGDRTIALCLLAEEQGYSPIGVTDGGGCIRDKETLKKLRKTILVGQCEEWLRKAKEINPRIQILDV